MDNWLGNKNVVRVIALGLGILLWAMTRLDSPEPPGASASQPRTYDILDVKVQPEGLDTEQYALKAVEPSRVQIRVRGRESVIRKLKPEDYQIRLNLYEAKEGVYTLPLMPAFPQGIELVAMYPPRVTVHIEKLQTKEFEVTIRTKGEPASGFKVGTPIVDAQRVHVTLPEGLLQTVESVQAEVDITGQDKAVKEKRVKLAAYDGKGQVIDGARINPSVVEVEIPITKPFKTIPLQVKYRGQARPGVSIASVTQSIDQVTIYAPQNVLDQFDFYDGIEIDLSQIQESMNLKVDLKLYGGVEQVQPSSVNIDIEVVPSEVRLFEQIPIMINGQNDQYETRIVDPPNGRLSVIVEGSADVLHNLSVKDIQAVADVSDLPPGPHQLRVHLILPALVKEAGEPIWVSVEIDAKTNPVTTRPDDSLGGGVDPPDGDNGMEEPTEPQAGDEGKPESPGTVPKEDASSEQEKENPSAE